MAVTSYSNEYTITIDVKSNISMANPIPTYTANDTNVLYIKILQDGQPYDYSNADRYLINLKRPDGVVVTGTGTYDSAKDMVKYSFGVTEMEVAGSLESSISLFLADTRITTRPFKIKILKDLEDGIESQEGYGVLQELFIEVEQVKADTKSAAQYAMESGDYAKAKAENFTHKGNYSPTSTYKNGNVVTYGGINYICIQDTTAGIDPLNGAYWTVVSPQASINDQTWTATEGQKVFTITNGNYVPNQSNIQVLVGGVPQVSGLGFTETNSTTITLSEGVPVGTTVFAKWFEGTMTITKGHKSSHEAGGQDQLDVSKLYNYKELVSDKFDSVSVQLAENAKRFSNMFVDVREDYGAKGDGVTNDLSAINSASYAVFQAGGGIVFFPKGTYYIDNGGAQIYTPSNDDYAAKRNLLLYPNVTFIGVGKSSIIKFKNAIASRNNFLFPYNGLTPYTLENAYSENNLIKDLAICSEYNGANPDTTDSLGIWGTLKNTLIENVWFYDIDSDAICLAGDTGINSENVTIRNCYINRTGRSGISIVRGYNVTVENNTISNCATGAGIACEQSTEIQPESYVKIINNKIDNVVNGIYLDMVGTVTGRQNARNLVVSKNTIHNVTNTGIRLDNIKGCNVSENYIRYASQIGIFCGDSYDVRITKNDIFDSLALGLYLSGGQKISATLNHIVDDQTNKTMTIGIQLLGVKFAKLMQNFIENTLRSGIVLQNMSHSHVKDNSITNSCIGRTDANDSAILFNFGAGDIRTNILFQSNIMVDLQTTPTMYRGIYLRGTGYTNTLVQTNIVSGFTATNYALSDATALNNLG